MSSLLCITCNCYNFAISLEFFSNLTVAEPPFTSHPTPSAAPWACSLCYEHPKGSRSPAAIQEACRLYCGPCKREEERGRRKKIKKNSSNGIGKNRRRKTKKKRRKKRTKEGGGLDNGRTGKKQKEKRRREREKKKARIKYFVSLSCISVEKSQSK